MRLKYALTVLEDTDRLWTTNDSLGKISKLYLTSQGSGRWLLF